MPIYTKGGDTGETSLFGGKRVSKNNLQIEACGSLDELSSIIGVVSSFSPFREEKESNSKIQKELYLIMGVVAGYNQKLDNLEKETVKLEKKIDSLDSKMPKLKNFIIPGTNTPSAFYHLARSVCRRAERRVVSTYLSKDVHINKNELGKAMKYLNRLSDFFFHGRKTSWT